jgi:hypothetical protein
MADSPHSDPHELRTDALARIDAVERSLEQLAATVRSTAADIQQELSEVRLSVLEMHSHAVSKPAPAPEAAVGGTSSGVKIAWTSDHFVALGRQASSPSTRYRLTCRTHARALTRAYRHTHADNHAHAARV